MTNMPDESNSDNVEPYVIDADVANIIMLSRIYDLLLVIAEEANESKTEYVHNLHKLGQFFGPPPMWNFDEDEG